MWEPERLRLWAAPHGIGPRREVGMQLQPRCRARPSSPPVGDGGRWASGSLRLTPQRRSSRAAPAHWGRAVASTRSKSGVCVARRPRRGGQIGLQVDSAWPAHQQRHAHLLLGPCLQGRHQRRIARRHHLRSVSSSLLWNRQGASWVTATLAEGRWRPPGGTEPRDIALRTQWAQHNAFSKQRGPAASHSALSHTPQGHAGRAPPGPAPRRRAALRRLISPPEPCHRLLVGRPAGRGERRLSTAFSASQGICGAFGAQRLTWSRPATPCDRRRRPFWAGRARASKTCTARWAAHDTQDAHLSSASPSC